jgi:hypothetical protein
VGLLLDEQECEGSRYHSPTPLYVRRWRCWYASGLVVEADGESHDDDVWLCGTCAHNLRLFMQLMTATNGEMSWETRREFGNEIRRIAKQMWGVAHA